MPASIADVTQWLESQTDKELVVIKHEDRDLDEVRIRLERVERRGERSEALDDYTNGASLMLMGSGTVVTEGREEPLPSDAFEIPLEGLSLTETAEGAALLVTERARYSIKVRD
ncbi:hypothetical protein OMP38_24970 [Cohnella ginsengisoli]|uniref:Uncharacterized protein n=1 Tax=Cohnella ginsengisoli TaxID=425004 RepID=A0A9X4QPP2_9BACL|nr:hypothetical protein [Cohnella ginsengisoli]MDG0793717.1 hypothetical protein [Cohnella ginsengisoli]